MPSPMLPVNGMRIAHKKAGRAFCMLPQSTSLTSQNICAPTRIKTGESAHLGIADMNGENRNDVSNEYTPITTDINPVRPPSRIPAEADILIKTGEDPSNAETDVHKPHTM
eukprot:gnl/MRDRNA2_/MRDRNA2_421749_c0_seq1.p2 gnl/MRDRNA2_/MRDRNA2_421749_c0~~gnl/MRDRNA2_/MRDRNA2_421749_c0_seq1.p2  ORF type:complete len:111 (+),score=11.90 gnl/MRDRNA2_/MRDRNA2_421749_c0_seq1:147-479(+)